MAKTSIPVKGGTLGDDDFVGEAPPPGASDKKYAKDAFADIAARVASYTADVKKGLHMDDDFIEQDHMQKRGARNNKTDKTMIQQMHDHSVSLGASCNGMEKHDAAVDYDKSARIVKIDDALGLVFGYAIVCTKNGEPYYDLNIDKGDDGTFKRVPEHIPEDAMLKASVEFAQTARVGNEMHSGPDTGEYVFMFPMTADIAKAFGIQTQTTGLMIAYKPTPGVLAKFKDGTYTGFSIEGMRIAAVETE